MSKLPGAVTAGLKAVDRAFPWALVYRGTSVECPCCGGQFRRFRRHAGRPNARCPRCASLERHRLLWLYLRARGDLFEERLDVLHFAPETAFEQTLSSQSNLRYVGADLRPKTERQVRVDITEMQFGDESFDLILCNHVLGEVPDDRKAIVELHRVLRPGGRLICQQPVDHTRSDTRDRHHAPLRPGEPAGENLRTYGRDFVDRLSAPGLEVDLVRHLESVSEAERRRFGLEERGGIATGNDIWVATKQKRAQAV